jgi:hypothetical protein
VTLKSAIRLMVGAVAIAIAAFALGVWTIVLAAKFSTSHEQFTPAAVNDWQTVDPGDWETVGAPVPIFMETWIAVDDSRSLACRHGYPSGIVCRVDQNSGKVSLSVNGKGSTLTGAFLDAVGQLNQQTK